VMSDPNKLFDALLTAMVHGEAPSAGKKSSSEEASSEERDAYCSDTQTPPDTSEDALRSHGYVCR
jgi:hypothetical protein